MPDIVSSRKKKKKKKKKNNNFFFNFWEEYEKCSAVFRISMYPSQAKLSMKIIEIFFQT